MKIQGNIACLMASIGIMFSLPLVAQEVERSESKTYTNANGNTVEIERKASADADGNIVKKQQFHITDSNGDTVAAGKDRDWQTEDGRQGSSQAGVKYDADGNRILKRRQAQTDGDGNIRERHGKSVRDEDGELTAKGIDGQASKDGTEYRTQKRTRVKADGDTVTKIRRGKLDDQGNKTVVRKQRTRSPQSGTRKKGG